jgi:hypothetical protein
MTILREMLVHLKKSDRVEGFGRHEIIFNGNSRDIRFRFPEHTTREQIDAVVKAMNEALDASSQIEVGK